MGTRMSPHDSQYPAIIKALEALVRRLEVQLAHALSLNTAGSSVTGAVSCMGAAFSHEVDSLKHYKFD